MPSLDEAFDRLAERLAGPASLAASRSDPFYYFVYPPEQTLEVRRRLPAWTARLRNQAGLEVERVSFSDLLWRIVDRSNRWDAWLEVGYCLQYGIGTRRDPTAAIRAYRRAIRSYYTTEYGCEEAQYHLAVALLDRGDRRYHPEVERLLSRAAEDGDYPEAAHLLEQVGEKRPSRICRCRRGLVRRLGGKTHCPLHRRPGARPIRKG